MNTSPFGHDSYRLGAGIPATDGPLRSCMRYIHDPQELFKAPYRSAGVQSASRRMPLPMRVTKRKPAATLVVGRALRLLRVIPEPSSPSSYPTELETSLSPTPYRLPV